MKRSLELLEGFCTQLPCKATIEIRKHGGDVELLVVLHNAEPFPALKDEEPTRPLVGVLFPYGQWPAIVEYYHYRGRAPWWTKTGYRYEWGIDPNQPPPPGKNPPTIDNVHELKKLLDALLKLPETEQTLQSMA